MVTRQCCVILCECECSCRRCLQISFCHLLSLRPWLVLLVEPLHGLTFAGVWTATVEYARRLAKTGTEAKMQALISGTWPQQSVVVVI